MNRKSTKPLQLEGWTNNSHSSGEPQAKFRLAADAVAITYEMNWTKTIEDLRIARIVVRAWRLVRGAVSLAIHNPTRAFLAIRTGLLLLKQHGFKEFRRSLLQAFFEWNGVLERGHRPPVPFSPPDEVDPYEAWLEVNNWNDRCLRHLTERLQAASDTLPKISIVVSVSSPAVELLLKMFSSVRNQVYQDWELCVVDDCRPDTSVKDMLAKWESADKRIGVVPSHQGEASATSDAFRVAKGEFLAFLNQHDELTPDALAEVALYIAQHPETDFLYSDHDTVDVDGRRHSPQFKPDWSPELLLSCNYCGPLVAVRRSLFPRLEGLSLEADPCRDYDFAFRATELARHVGHIPSILYHRRQIPGSHASQAPPDIDNDQPASLALRRAFERRGIRATPYRLQQDSDFISALYGYEFPDNGPSVGILISNRDSESDIVACVHSLAQTTYKNYEAFVLDRSGKIVRAETCSNGCSGHVRGLVADDSSVNWAYLMNAGVRQLHTDYLLFSIPR